MTRLDPADAMPHPVSTTSEYDRIRHELADARTAAGLTQQDVADTLGTSPTAISYYESGRRMPGADRWIELAAAVGRRFVLQPLDVTPGMSPADAYARGWGDCAAAILGAAKAACARTDSPDTTEPKE